MRVLASLLIALLGLVACSSAHGQATAVRLGGVRLALDDDGSDDRNFVALVGAFLLKNGGIAVVGTSPPAVRVYDKRGQVVRTLGRTGGGPAEFGFIGWAGADADSLRFYDPILRRFTACGRDGCERLVSQTPPVTDANRPYAVIGQVAAGVFLVRSADGTPEGHELGLIDSRERLGTLSSSSGHVDWIAELPGMRWLRQPPVGGHPGPIGPAAFAKQSSMMMVSGSLWLTDSHADTVRVYDWPFTRRAPNVLLLGLARRVPSREAVEKSLARDLVRFNRNDSHFLRTRYQRENLPATLPAFDDWKADRGGLAWVRQDDFAGIGRSVYLAFAADGTRRFELSLPLFHQLADFSDGEVVIIGRDDDGLVRVEVRSWIAP